jgi:hypothetical protein
MSKLNQNYTVYKNTWVWMRAMNIDTDEKQMDIAPFMDAMVTQQYIIIKAMEKKRPVNVVVVSNTNAFTKKKDVDRVVGNLPMDGSTRIVIISKNVSSTFDGMSFVQNVPHVFLICDIRKHVNQPESYEVVRDIDRVKWDMFIMDDSGLKNGGRIKMAVDPMPFWLGAQKGDFIFMRYPAEDAVNRSEYRLVV